MVSVVSRARFMVMCYGHPMGTPRMLRVRDTLATQLRALSAYSRNGVGGRGWSRKVLRHSACTEHSEEGAERGPTVPKTRAWPRSHPVWYTSAHLED